MNRSLLFGVLSICALATNVTRACHRCGVAACTSCATASSYVSAQNSAGYPGGITRRADGSIWRGNVEYEQVERLDAASGKWVLDYQPKRLPTGLPAAAPFQPTAGQGTTVYGYSLTGAQTSTYAQPSYQAYSAAYAPDPAQSFNLAARLVQQASELHGQGLAGFLGAVKAVGDGAARVAEINATGAAAVAALNAAKAQQPASVTSSYQFEATLGPDGNWLIRPTPSPAPGPGPSPAPSPQPVPSPPAPRPPSRQAVENLAAENLATLAAVAQQKCAACHSGAAAHGKFDVARLGELDAAGFARVMSRLESPDPNLRMPQAPPGQSAATLTFEEKRAFYDRYERLSQ